MPRPLTLSVMDNLMVVSKLPDKTLMGVFMRETGEISEAAAIYSKDNGRTWSEPEVLLRLTKEYGNWWCFAESFLDRDGELHLFLLNDAGGGLVAVGEGERVLAGELTNTRLDIWHTRSKNGRKEFSQPKLVWKGYTGALNSVLQMSTGRIVLPFSWLTKRAWDNRGGGLNEFTFMGQYDCTVIYSDDSGATWNLGSNLRVPVPDIISAYGAVEPVILPLKDGRLWMLIRTQQGRFWESFSIDGAAWSPPEPSTITSSDSPAGLVRLDDGRIVLLWNNCQRYPYAFGGRQVLHAAISDDEGKTWRGYREVARDPKRNDPPPPRGDFGTAYPFPTVVNDGKILYCTGQGAGRVLLMLLDPEWLLETAQSADFANAADEWSIFGTKGVEILSHPDKSGAKVLKIQKTTPDWPTAAVWNFPSLPTGTLRMKFQIQPGSKGLALGITDHFSTPFDLEDKFFNLVNLELTSEKLPPNQWHTLQLEWTLEKRECKAILNNQPATILPLRRETTGPCYLRLRSLARETEAGQIIIESAEIKNGG
jgi:hypothetical protein